MNSQGVILAKQANQKSYFKVKSITLHYFSYIQMYIINSYSMRLL